MGLGWQRMEPPPCRMAGAKSRRMSRLRLIPRLDVKGPNLIKGIRLEGLRVIGDPHEHAVRYYEQGADELAVNTAVIARPKLISEMAERFGSQCVVLSIEAKKLSDGKWEAYTDNGRERTGLDVVEWAKQAVSLGAGEILITSVDREGT